MESSPARIHPGTNAPIPVLLLEVCFFNADGVPLAVADRSEQAFFVSQIKRLAAFDFFRNPSVFKYSFPDTAYQ
jgi:hypothetical protein